MTHRLLILGSLTEFVLLTQMARERGIYTIVCDGNPSGPAKEVAHRSYDIDIHEIDSIVTLCKEERVDGIITSFSDILFECMVKIAAKAGIRCYLSPAQLCYYRDKSVMNNMLKELKIATQNYVCLDSNFEDSDLDAIHFPVVAKPLNSYGSRGIFVFDNPEDIRTHFSEICESSDSDKVLVEEYDDGFEFNMMAWVLDGQVHVISIADREKTFIAKERIPISTRNVYPSRLMSSVYLQATAILEKIVAYTKQMDGALSMQFFWKPNRAIQVGEVAGRFLGYEHELVEYSGGLCMEKLLLDYVYDEHALRRTLKHNSPWFSRCSAVLYFHGLEKDIANQQKLVSLTQEEDVVNSILFYQEGEQIDYGNPRPYVARCYITADDRESIDARTLEIFKEVSILDSQGEEVLFSNKIPEYPL